MSDKKRPARRRGWERLPGVIGLDADSWRRKNLLVLSSLSVMAAPDSSGDSLPTWLVSVSRAGSAMPGDRDLARVRRDFGMLEAEEDNHEDGIARKLFLVVDPARRVACECKTGERVVERVDGYRYSVEQEDS